MFPMTDTLDIELAILDFDLKRGPGHRKHGDHDQSTHGSWASGSDDVSPPQTSMTDVIEPTGETVADLVDKLEPLLDPKHPDYKPAHVLGSTEGESFGRDAFSAFATPEEAMVDTTKLIEAWKTFEGNGTMREDAAALKIENVSHMSRSMIEAAYDDPDLQNQLIAAAFASTNAEAVTEDQIAAFSAAKQDEMIAIGAAEIADALQRTWAETASDSDPVSIGLQLAIAEKFNIDAEDIKGDIQGNNIKGYWEGEGEEIMGSQWASDFAIEHAGSGASVNQAAEEIANSPAVQHYVEETYTLTQAFLDSLEVEELTLYRGIALSDPKENLTSDRPPDTFNLDERGPGRGPEDFDIRMNPLSSFSLQETVAQGFTTGDSEYDRGYVIEVTVPSERVFSIPMTGVGCLNEREVTVIAPKHDFTQEARVLRWQ